MLDLMVSLREADQQLVLDLRSGRLPAVVHWGADLGALTAADARVLADSGVTAVGPSEVDEPVRLAILPEHWTGWSGRPGISGSRAGADWSPRFTTTGLRIDPAPAEPADEAVSEQSEQSELVELVGPSAIEISAEDSEAQLGLVLRVEMLPGGLVRAQAELINRGPDYQLDDLVLAFPVPPLAAELLDFAGRWGKERVPQRRPLPVGSHVREGRRGRTGADAATVLHLGVPGFGFADGDVWAVHTGWSGNHTHYAERLASGHQVIGGGELLLPGELVLPPDQSYLSPWIYAGHGRGLDRVARRFHRYLRSRPQHVDIERPVTLNVWEAVYFDHDLAKLTALAELAGDLGVERYVLDDGWFGSRRDDHSGLGDWTVSPDVWPDGLDPLIDKVTGLGMQFGLWVEPEMINLDSDVARAHPEWVLATGGREPLSARHQQVINLALPECYAYIRKALGAILDRYRISYLKWDHNRDLVDAGSQPSGRAGVHQQTLAAYRLMAELKADHPGLEIESCSSGGARVDLGVLQHTDRVWVSDCIDPAERQQMHRWTSQLIPPELMGAHIASGRSHTTGRVHDLDYRAATALFGHLGIEWDLTQASADELTELRRWLAVYKEHRGLLLRGDLVRVDFPDDTVLANGVLAADRNSALFAITSVGRSEVSAIRRLRLPGLEPDRRYRVQPLLPSRPSGLRAPLWWGAASGLDQDRGELFSGVEISGAALARLGLAVPQLDPDHSVVYLIKAV